MGFNKDFIWGAATASYQIEGAHDKEGKGLSVWDAFCLKEDAVKNGENGNNACDHYNRSFEDVKMMKELGMKAYRFSISWPRVLPKGVGNVNKNGLDFYDKLVDDLLESEIKPIATLFHWDFPFELYCRGGWLNDDSPDWFAEYTKLMAETLGDRVNTWCTFNEPIVFGYLGHASGIHAPGIKLGPLELDRMARNILLAHGDSVQALRDNTPESTQIGIAANFMFTFPENNDQIDDAYNAMFDGPKPFNPGNSIWTDPIYLGKQSEAALKISQSQLGNQAIVYTSDELKRMSRKVDFLGINLYSGSAVSKSGEDGKASSYSPDFKGKPGAARSAFDWPVEPRAMYWACKFLKRRYDIPIYVTENGMSNLDWVSEDGKVHDYQRIDYMHKYLKALKKAAEDGVDIKGYLHWSLMDNFEWAEGYKHRFGLVYVDFETFERIPKDSAYWYKNVIETNGAEI